MPEGSSSAVTRTSPAKPSRRRTVQTGITLDQLKGAPKYANDDAFNWSDATRTRAINEYYGVPLVA